ncbi:HutD family protein [Streptomyces sp. NPDC059837]|uniref:HutD/Ves family protein n=1 Tax=unclassified Streptomyces TaxID=2593676 RepID=UPI00224D8C1E|nr:HutD family protein [Streptomyces sp. NBC_01764]MCX4401390.1 HutD family protein [Streptomyces sp. NBC_01764]
MTVRALPAAGRVAVPWKNGGGVTREIAARPEGAGMGEFEWRVSLADVGADGPFSAFADVDRILTMVEGEGMELTVGGEHRRVDTRFVPQRFPGDLPTGCRLLGGPVVNLNVMWHRGAAVAPTVTVAAPGRSLALPAGPTVVIVALDGTAEVAGVSLGRGDAVLLTDEEATLHTTGHTAVLTLPPRA